jgi:prepilin-type N-terminal cleavage/methylation domain-containing protein
MRATTIERQAGFSLVELLVSMVLVSLVLGVAFELFNSTNKLSRAQLHQADLQQASRVAQRDLLRVARMAGRGGLPGYAVAGLNPASAPASVTPAIEVRNNITTADQRLVSGNATSPLVVAGTDVVTVRGHFTSGPVFVDSTDPSVFEPNPLGGKITIASIGPTGIPQNIAPLVDAVDEERPDAILIVSSLTDLIYGVAEIDPANSNIASYNPDPLVYSEVTIAYLHTGGFYASQYGLLSASGVFPDINVDHPDWLPPRELSNVGMVALLEEYRYYVRDPEDGTAPRLSVGRFFPGTQIPHCPDCWQSDIADNIFDLQVALGFDSSFDGAGSTNGFFDFDPDNTGDDDIIVDGDLVAGATKGLDDWLFNDAADTTNLGAPPWTPLPASGTDPPLFPSNQPRPRLYYVRLSTLSLAGSADSGYQAPLVTNIEDNVYPTDADNPVNGDEGRQKRRLLLTTIVDLRNI